MSPSSARTAPAWRRLVAYVPTSFLLFAIIQTFFLVFFACSANAATLAPRGEGVRIALTYVVGFLVFSAVHLLFARRPRAERWAALVLLVLVTMLDIARQRTAGGFDYGFLHDHGAELFTSLGFGIFLDEFKTWVVFVLLSFPPICFYALYRRPHVPLPWPRRRRLVALAVVSVTLFGILSLPIPTHEAFTSFARSMFRFHVETRAALAADDARVPYPYVHTPVQSARARSIAAEPAPRPNVILLFNESQGGLFVRRARPDGTPYTPVFDRHAREALSVARFYSNSVASSRGHFSTLCSLLPMYRGKEFVELEDKSLRCLPSVLRDAGYATKFYSATGSPRFDNTDVFFARTGFSQITFQPKDTAIHDPNRCGLGLRDDHFYRLAFADLDAELARDDHRPIFAVLANASNHWPFDNCPGHEPVTFEATLPRAHYVASTIRSDAWLETFFEEIDRRPALRDAIVIVVGDHGFPADEHATHVHMLGAYEESFRTGFLLRWSGHVVPELDETRTASQIDVAPTIVDLLGLSEPNAFQGRSLFAEPELDRPALMVQPFDGVWLVANRWPFKFARRESTGEEHLYDLSRDPGEAADVIERPELRDVAAELRASVATLYVHRTILRSDRVWPPSGGQSVDPKNEAQPVADGLRTTTAEALP